MFRELNRNSCNSSLYLICIIIVIILIVLLSIYIIKGMCRPRAPPTNETENYIISSGGVVPTGKNSFVSNGTILTNQMLDKPSKEVMDTSKSHITDHDKDPAHVEHIDKVMENGAKIRDILRKGDENNILSRDDLKEAAKMMHEAETEHGIFKRTSGAPRKLVIAEPGVSIPVLECNGSNGGKHVPMLERGKSQKIIATDKIHVIPRYDIGSEGCVFDKDFHSSTVFNNYTPDKIITEIETDGVSKSKAIRDNLYTVNNNRIKMKTAYDKTSDYALKRASTPRAGESGFRVDSRALLVN